MSLSNSEVFVVCFQRARRMEQFTISPAYQRSVTERFQTGIISLQERRTSLWRRDTSVKSYLPTYFEHHFCEGCRSAEAI